METYCKHWETVRTHTVSVVFIAVIWKTCQRGDSFILLPQRAYSSQQHAWTCMYCMSLIIQYREYQSSLGRKISFFKSIFHDYFEFNPGCCFRFKGIPFVFLSFWRLTFFLMSPLKTFIVKCMTTPLIFTCKSKAPVCRWFINLQNKTETSHILQIISVIKARSVDDPYFMLITLNGHACQIYGRNQTDSFSMFKGETALS